MQKTFSKKNNAGFTLLEVLVAVIILAIISVPLLRSFATAAQTNQKAKIEATCTNAAENVAEGCRNVKADDIVERYIGKEFEASDYDATSGAYVYEVVDDTSPVYGNKAELTDDGVYTITVKNQDSMSSGMPEGYYCEITLDPSVYKNSNEVNLAQIEPVSIKDSAIFTMEEDFDSKAYDMFVQRSKTSGLPIKKDKEWFKENLTRNITFDIDYTGTVKADKDGKLAVADGDGNYPEGTEDVDIVNVVMTVEYILEGSDASSVLPLGQQNLVYTTAYLFDNSTERVPLSSIYLFYYPRYSAGCAKPAKSSTNNMGRDNIIVNNLENVEANLYITALKGAENENKLQSYCNLKALGLNIFENPASTADKGALVLRTNMNTGAPYNKQDKALHADKGSLLVSLKYMNASKTINISDEAAGKFLSAANTDGKVLNVDDTPNRIYKMKVKVYDDQPPQTVYDESGNSIGEMKNPVVDFDGTKLEY